ncbi:hypothetical protein ANN_09950 [Periplaneta americana]|uniref:Reverse transcriptase domain-containing protein n=1 Tax=Periplaneta americana TaxID=6978 RepID=A0ABQ8TMP6_PERAM|nr:hypothetical protein ANN_09950 [Periplaneta americana]
MAGLCEGGNEPSGSLKAICTVVRFADDLQLYIHSRPDEIDATIGRLNRDLNQISSWTNKFGLRLNAIGRDICLSSPPPVYKCELKTNVTFVPNRAYLLAFRTKPIRDVVQMCSYNQVEVRWDVMLNHMFLHIVKGASSMSSESLFRRALHSNGTAK